MEVRGEKMVKGRVKRKGDESEERKGDKEIKDT